MTFVTIIDFCKKYWWGFIILVVLICAGLKMHSMQKVLDATLESSQSQITTLQKNHDAELKGRDEIIQKHEAELKDIEDRYDQQSTQLAQERAKKIKVIVKYYDNPEKLAAKITETYGFKYEPIPKISSNSR